MSQAKIQPITDGKIIERLSLKEKSSLYRDLYRPLLVHDKNELQKLLSFDTSEPQNTDEYRHNTAYKSIVAWANRSGVDFEAFYLFAIFHKENNGTVEVSVSNPMWIDSETIFIELDTKLPVGSPMLDVISYYGFIYKVHKSVKNLKVNHSTYVLEDGLSWSWSKPDDSMMSDEDKEIRDMMAAQG